jgi:hypothetical protein
MEDQARGKTAKEGRGCEYGNHPTHIFLFFISIVVTS